MKKSFLPLLVILTAAWLYGTTGHINQSFLWKAEKGGQTAYLLGSIHMADQSLFPLNPEIESAYSACNTLVVEVDMGKAANELPALIAEHAFFKDSQTLQSTISPEHYTQAQTHIKKSGIEPSSVAKVKPWYLSLIFTNLSLQRIGADTSYGIDAYFTSRAVRDKKEIIELEGAALQIQKLDNLPLAEQELLMVSSIIEDEDMEDSFKEMMQLWSSGDIPGMQRFFNDSFAPYPELKSFNEDFLIRRNRDMSQKIDRLIKSGKKILVIVGAAHFLGEEGIISLLEGHGYRVTRP